MDCPAAKQQDRFLAAIKSYRRFTHHLARQESREVSTVSTRKSQERFIRRAAGGSRLDGFISRLTPAARRVCRPYHRSHKYATGAANKIESITSSTPPKPGTVSAASLRRQSHLIDRFRQVPQNSGKADRHSKAQSPPSRRRATRFR